MPALDRSGSALIHPTGGYDLASLEMSKFNVVNGTTYVNVLADVQIGTAVFDAQYYQEGTTIGTINGPALVFRGTGGTIQPVGTATPLPVTLQTLIAGEDLTNTLLGVLQKPVASSTYTPSDHTNFGAAAGTGVFIKASAGNVYAFDVTSATTAIRYFQLYNQATAPVLGQTAVASYKLGSVAAGAVYRLQINSQDLAPSKYFSVGIAAAISSTEGTLGTASITAGDHSWHIKYV